VALRKGAWLRSYDDPKRRYLGFLVADYVWHLIPISKIKPPDWGGIFLNPLVTPQANRIAQARVPQRVAWDLIRTPTGRLELFDGRGLLRLLPGG